MNPGLPFTQVDDGDRFFGACRCGCDTVIVQRGEELYIKSKVYPEFERIKHITLFINKKASIPPVLDNLVWDFFEKRRRISLCTDCSLHFDSAYAIVDEGLCFCSQECLDHFAADTSLHVYEDTLLELDENGDEFPY
jgi:hypothetical protein